MQSNQEFFSVTEAILKEGKRDWRQYWI